MISPGLSQSGDKQLVSDCVGHYVNSESLLVSCKPLPVMSIGPLGGQRNSGVTEGRKEERKEECRVYLYDL